MMPLSRRILSAFAVMIGMAMHARAQSSYSVALATAYSQAWYQTAVNNPNNLVDHINGSRAAPPGPYAWYWLSDPNTGSTTKNDGDGTINALLGEDCTNFGSQELKAGGVQMAGHLGQGGTFLRVRELAGALTSQLQDGSNTESQEKARAVVGTPLTVELFSGFVKDPANLTFRCNGFVEWINELAGTPPHRRVLP